MEVETPSLSPVATSDVSPCSHASQVPFEDFTSTVRQKRLPIVVFSDSACEQLVWYDGEVQNGRVQCPSREPDVWAKDAVVMSPAYLGFAIEPYECRYLHYKGVGIVFARPFNGKFMQPSIDTILVCRGLALLFERTGCKFQRVVDVGTGSGFIAKFAAMYAPGDGRLSIHLLDIDPAAEQYCKSDAFGARGHGIGGRELEWNAKTMDAAKFLEEDSKFDLIISNPPYIPAYEEAVNEEGLAQPANFWEGCGLLVRLIELMLEGRYPAGAHMVLMVTSLSLKSHRLRAVLAEAPSQGVNVRILVEREIAWKAWYAGRGFGHSYLMATSDERDRPVRLAGCDFLVGATPPGSSRTKGEEGERRNRLFGYHWHVAYVVHFSRD